MFWTKPTDENFNFTVCLTSSWLFWISQCNSWDNWLIYSWAICSVSYLDSWVSGPKPGSTVLNLSNPWLRRSILLLSRAFAARRLFFNTDSDISSSGFFTLPALLEYFIFWHLLSLSTFWWLLSLLLLRSTGWISCRGRCVLVDAKEPWEDFFWYEVLVVTMVKALL